MINAPSQARYIFEKFTAKGAASVLRNLPTNAEKTFEDDWLDFKAGNPRDDENLKRIWSKALGSFANNEGGVLVWGINSKKDAKTGIDAVQSLSLVPNVFALRTRLMELRPQATDPPIENVEIIEIPLATGSPEGFVICFIPESIFKPHRSEYCDRKFYLRMGDSSRECSVSLLRQLFYPRISHRFLVSLTRIRRPAQLPRMQVPPFSRNSGSRDDIKDVVRIGFHNIGQSSAEEVFVNIRCGTAQVNSFEWNHAAKEFDVDVLFNYYRVAKILHSGMRSFVLILIATQEANWNSPWEFQIFAKAMNPKKVTIYMEADLPADNLTLIEAI